MRRFLFLLTFGLGGAAILIALGSWQVQRLAWKEAIIADINARIVAAPVALPTAPDVTRDAYLPVRAQGVIGAEYLRVLVSQKRIGAGYRIISAFETDAGRVLVDRGFIRNDDPVPAAPDAVVDVTGNLQWPQETDKFTPAPDLGENIWFARDVSAMAQALDTRPVLIVARSTSFSDAPISPFPVNTAVIPNDHLNYAITWYSLAVIWLLMTAFFLRRRPAPALKD